MTTPGDIYLADYEAGMPLRAIARKHGKHNTTVLRAVRAAQRRNALDPSIRSALEAKGLTDMSGLHSGWLKTEPDENGRSESLYFHLGRDGEAAESLLDRIKDAFSDIPAAAPVDVPDETDSDLLTVYPIADAHIGMLAWGRESGEDYDSRIAANRVIGWVRRAVAAAPPSDTAVIVDVGDLMHADDQKNMTPGSGHILDVDTRYFRTVDITIWTMVHAIDAALAKHSRVIVSILKGNHDPHAHIAVMFALAAHYRDEPRVDVQKRPGDFFIMEWGRVMLAANHGDKAGPDRLVHTIAADNAEMWGRTSYRYLFTGHKHSLRSADIGGMVWEQLNAMTARDYYAFSHAFYSRAQLSAITYHRESGVKSRVYVNP